MEKFNLFIADGNYSNRIISMSIANQFPIDLDESKIDASGKVSKTFEGVKMDMSQMDNFDVLNETKTCTVDVLVEIHGARQ